MITPAAQQRILSLIDDARDHGATIVSGGTASGSCIAPTIISNITPQMRLYAQESFGPVVTVEEFSEVSAAVESANSSPYALSAAVFSQNDRAARDLAGQIEAGMCHINGSTVHDEPQMPFGGLKDSGWGRFGGDAAVAEFTELRWITSQAGHREYAF